MFFSPHLSNHLFFEVHIALSRAQKKDGNRLFFCFVYFVENHINSCVLNIVRLNIFSKKLHN